MTAVRLLSSVFFFFAITTRTRHPKNKQRIYLLRLTFKLKTIIYYGVMPLLLDLCRLNLTVAHAVQVFIHRLFRVVEIMGGGGFRSRRLSDFGQNIFFTAGFFACLFSFVRPFWKERVQARNFLNGFSSFLLPIVFLLYNCNTIVHVTSHSLE